MASTRDVNAITKRLSMMWPDFARLEKETTVTDSKAVHAFNDFTGKLAQDVHPQVPVEPATEVDTHRKR